jgi:hypothetical protein
MENTIRRYEEEQRQKKAQAAAEVAETPEQ